MACGVRKGGGIQIGNARQGMYVSRQSLREWG